jgi:hypothetical protein
VLDLLTLLAAQKVLALALIGFRAAHPFAQRLGINAQVSSDMSDRASGLEHQPRAALQQLLGILPRSCHARRLSFPADETTDQSLRQNQPGSVAATRAG